MAGSDCHCEPTRAEVPLANLHGIALAHQSSSASHHSLNTEDDLGFSDIDALSAVNALQHYLCGDDDTTSRGTRDDTNLTDFDAAETDVSENCFQAGLQAESFEPSHDAHHCREQNVQQQAPTVTIDALKASTPCEFEMWFQTFEEFEHTFRKRFNDMVYTYKDHLAAGHAVVFVPRLKCAVKNSPHLNTCMRKVVKACGVQLACVHGMLVVVNVSSRKKISACGGKVSVLVEPFKAEAAACKTEAARARAQGELRVAASQKQVASLFVRYLHQRPTGSLLLSEANAIIQGTTGLDQARRTIEESGGLRAWLHGYEDYFEITGQGEEETVNLTPGVKLWASLVTGSRRKFDARCDW